MSSKLTPISPISPSLFTFLFGLEGDWRHRLWQLTEAEREQIKEKAFIYSMMLVKDAVSHRMCPPASVWWGQAGARGGGLYCGAGLRFWAGPTSTPSTLFPVWPQRVENRLVQVTGKKSKGWRTVEGVWAWGVFNCLRYVKRSCGVFFGPFTFLVTAVNQMQSHKRNKTSHRCCEALNQRLACDAHSHLGWMYSKYPRNYQQADVN